MAAEDQTLWTDQVVKKSEQQGGEWPADGTILTSANIANTQDKPAIKIIVDYSDFVPDENTVAGYVLAAVLEEEIAQDVWKPLAVQDDPVRAGSGPFSQIIEINPQYGGDDFGHFTVQVGVDEVAFFQLLRRALASYYPALSVDPVRGSCLSTTPGAARHHR